MYALRLNKSENALNGLVSCLPISSEWDPKIEGHCVDQITLFTVALATDVVLDGEWFLLDIF